MTDKERLITLENVVDDLVERLVLAERKLDDHEKELAELSKNVRAISDSI